MSTATPSALQQHPELIRAGTRNYRRFLLGMCAAGIATFAQLYAPQGVLPLIARDFDESATSAALTMSAATLGLALALLPWSFVADRIGPLAAMRIALIAATTIGIASAFAPTVEILLAVRFVEGVALGGLPAIAMVLLYRELHPAAAAAAAAAYIAGTTIGGAVGRLAAGALAGGIGWRGALLVIAAACACATVAFFVLVRSNSRAKPSGQSLRFRQMLTGVRISVLDARLRVLYAIPLLLMGSFVAMYNYLGFRLEGQGFGLTSTAASFIFLSYLAGTLTSAMTGRWIPAFGRRRTALTGMVGMILGAALTLAGALAVVIIGLVLFTGGYFTVHATVSGWVGQHAVRARAQATAIYNISQYVGAALIGWAVGFLWAYGWAPVVATIIAITVLAFLVLHRGTRAVTDAIVL